jgi:hypothetical protein
MLRARARRAAAAAAWRWVALSALAAGSLLRATPRKGLGAPPELLGENWALVPRVVRNAYTARPAAAYSIYSAVHRQNWA